ncbi:unnamed protein product, partial [Mesorhabditis belari]|uniref:Uncharacterized protein n=1 Tax=Mesorhabditis belari TaxID=2138241 RepID=A0AAF3FQY4_9BILA
MLAIRLCFSITLIGFYGCLGLSFSSNSSMTVKKSKSKPLFVECLNDGKLLFKGTDLMFLEMIICTNAHCDCFTLQGIQTIVEAPCVLGRFLQNQFFVFLHRGEEPEMIGVNCAKVATCDAKTMNFEGKLKITFSQSMMFTCLNSLCFIAAILFFVYILWDCYCGRGFSRAWWRRGTRRAAPAA